MVKLTAVVTKDRDEDVYVARAAEVDVASQGETPQEAVANLREAVELYFEGEDFPAPQVSLVDVTPVEVRLSA